MLSAIMHADGVHAVASVSVAIQALLRIAPTQHGRYIQGIIGCVSEEVMQQVRETLPPQAQAPLSEFERRGSSFVRGREEGLRASLLTVLEVRGLVPDAPLRARIEACHDAEQLHTLIARAATIAELSELVAD